MEEFGFLEPTRWEAGWDQDLKLTVCRKTGSNVDSGEAGRGWGGCL